MVIDSEHKKLDDTGIVYLLINEAMPGFVKIGKTTRSDPQVRIDELYNSSVPVPFECVLAVKVENPTGLEKALHKAFASNRINPNREFFQIEPQQPAAILEHLISMGSQDVTPSVNDVNRSIPEKERKTLETLRRRRPRLNFKEMGIPEGSILSSISGDEAVKVLSERTVSYKDEEMSLSKATQMAREIDYTVGPCPYWKFEERSLSEIYNETYLYDQ